MTASITVFVGDPSPGSRTRRATEDLETCVADLTGAEVEETIAFAEVADEIFDLEPELLGTLTWRILRSTYAVIGSVQGISRPA